MNNVSQIVELSLLAKRANYSFFAQQIAKDFRTPESLLTSARGAVSSELLGYLLSQQCLELAANVAERKLCNREPVNKMYFDSLLGALKASGLWYEHNSLLTEYVLSANQNYSDTLFPHLLNQLDFKNADRILGSQIFKQCDNSMQLKKTCYEIARMNYTDALRRLDENSELMQAILSKSEYRKWIYMLCSQRGLEWAVNIYSILKSFPESSTNRLGNLTDLLKICWSYKWIALLKEIVSEFVFSGRLESLKNQVEFARVFVFTCDKLNLSNDLRDRLCSPSSEIFSKEELASIDLKKAFNEKGLDSLVTTYFGKVETVRHSYLEVPLLVYGQKYIDALEKFFVPSALAASDFMNFPKNYLSVISICTTPSSTERVRDVLRPLIDRGFKVEFPVAFNLTEEQIVHKRMWFYIYALHRVEMNQGVFINLCPDSVFGSGLGELIRKCPVGGGAGGNLVRASWNAMVSSTTSGDLYEILKSSDKNEALIRTGITKWRHYSQRIFFENISQNYLNKVVAGRRLNSWSGIAYVLKPDFGFAERLVNLGICRYSNVYGDHVFQPADHELIGDLLGRDKLYITKSFQEFVFIEMANDESYGQLWKFQLPLGHGNKPIYGETFPLL